MTRTTIEALDTPWRVMHEEYQQTDQTGAYEPLDWFAPEVETAIDQAASEADIDADALRDYLAQGYIPDGETPRESIKHAAENVASV